MAENLSVTITSAVTGRVIWTKDIPLDDVRTVDAEPGYDAAIEIDLPGTAVVQLDGSDLQDVDHFRQLIAQLFARDAERKDLQEQVS